MPPVRSNTADSLPTLGDNLSRVSRNSKSNPVLVLPQQYDRQWSNPIMTALSPPPSSKPAQPPRTNSHHRLRSDSGLALHTNQAAFRHRKYSNSAGPASARHPPARALSFDSNSSVEDFALDRSFSPELGGFVSNGKVIPDFFEPAVVKLAFSNKGTVRRLCAFAETRHDGSDIDFLRKVEEYSRALGNLISSMSYISSNFTGTTATSPLELSSEVAGALKSDIKYCARSALPALDKVYRDAKSTAEDRLSKSLYPEFVKYQLSRRLTTSLTSNRSLTGETNTPYPGLGEAFCLTDPYQPDNPVVFASNGLLAMSGYSRRQLVGRNCRLLQGIATEATAAFRLSQAVMSGREATELLINYRPDGTPYWNLLFICPLMENGTVRYFLGAQVNVSENMGSDYMEIMGVLNFGPPRKEQPTLSPESPTSPIWPARQSSDKLELPSSNDQHEEKHEEKPGSRRWRFFHRLHRKAPSPRATSPEHRSTASEPATDDNSSPPQASRNGPPPSPFSAHMELHQRRPSEQQLDENSTPYSRFLVMRYTSPHPPSTTNNRRQQSGSKRLARSAPPRLPVSFCSSHALSLLGLEPQPQPHSQPPESSLLGSDIFSVLSSHFNSPTLDRTFKAEVLARLDRGESVTADLMVRVGSPEGSARGAKSGAPIIQINGTTSGSATSSGEALPPGDARPRVSGSLDRGAGFLSHVLSSGGRGALKRIVSSWVALKDGEGKVGWVILVLTPAEGECF
ncbi:hypothetical protein F5144DRAFT_602875 [Chaetomium tenue]|uniref:Uncharacterized protein n=1 Tax=Chaetomium tenue TaxID=1854479 RepID=A0ACB7P7G0_9PEZI|nr:hypothetical protein F5144DRAFT_602875 [Chaetomium globosum]